MMKPVVLDSQPSDLDRSRIISFWASALPHEVPLHGQLSYNLNQSFIENKEMNIFHEYEEQYKLRITTAVSLRYVYIVTHSIEVIEPCLR